MSWKGVITDVGRDLLAQYVSGHVAINVNMITAGSGLVTTENMRYAMNLSHYEDDGTILKKTDVSNGVDFEFRIGPGTNGAYTAHEIGMWANVEEGSGILLALFQNEDGITIPDKALVTDFSYILSAVLVIDNLDTLTITVDPIAYVDFGTYNERVRQVNEWLDTKVDKVEGKGLTPQEYTLEEKQKLAGIEENANKYTLPVATSNTLGGVKIGTGINVDANGVISNSAVRSVTTGTENGTIAVNTNGTTADVPVKGIASAAYREANTFANSSHKHNASDITEGTLPTARGGTGITSNPSALVNLGSESTAGVFQNEPRPGVTGILPVAHGGTGSSSASSARANLGAAAASHTHGAGDIASGVLPVIRGGTGIAANPSMQIDLGSGSAASVFQTSPRPGVTGVLPLANGGTGANSASGARTNIGAAALSHKHGYADLSGVAAASHKHGYADLSGVAAASHKHGYADLSGVAAASHTHSTGDITGLPDTMGFFTGDGVGTSAPFKRKITLPFTPSKVLIFCFFTKQKSNYAYLRSGTVGVHYSQGTQLIKIARGENYINYHSWFERYVTSTSEAELDEYFAEGYGGAAITTNGFYVACGTTTTSPTSERMENTSLINAIDCEYMYYAWR